MWSDSETQMCFFYLIRKIRLWNFERLFHHFLFELLPMLRYSASVVHPFLATVVKWIFDNLQTRFWMVRSMYFKCKSGRPHGVQNRDKRKLARKSIHKKRWEWLTSNRTINIFAFTWISIYAKESVVYISREDHLEYRIGRRSIHWRKQILFREFDSHFRCLCNEKRYSPRKHKLKPWHHSMGCYKLQILVLLKKC